jgi:hypothetical protein
MLVPRPGPGSSGQQLPYFRLPVGLAFALGFGASIVMTLLAWFLGAGDAPGVGLFLLTVTAAAVGATTTPLGAVAAASTSWMLDDGFILNRFGVLTLDHRAVTALAVIVLAAVVPSLLVMPTRRLRGEAVRGS